MAKKRHLFYQIDSIQPLIRSNSFIINQACVHMISWHTTAQRGKKFLMKMSFYRLDEKAVIDFAVQLFQLVGKITYEEALYRIGNDIERSKNNIILFHKIEIIYNRQNSKRKKQRREQIMQHPIQYTSSDSEFYQELVIAQDVSQVCNIHMTCSFQLEQPLC